MKNKYDTSGTVPNSNRKVVERDNIDTPNTNRTFMAWYRHLYKRRWRVKLVTFK